MSLSYLALRMDEDEAEYLCLSESPVSQPHSPGMYADAGSSSRAQGTGTNYLSCCCVLEECKVRVSHEKVKTGNGAITAHRNGGAEG